LHSRFDPDRCKRYRFNPVYSPIFSQAFYAGERGFNRFLQRLNCAITCCKSVKCPKLVGVSRWFCNG